MAGIKKEAQYHLDTARDGIGWIAVWKDGKTELNWNLMSCWPDYDEHTNTYTFDPDELERLRSITRKDLGAVLVNSYYYNLGDVETMTSESLADALRYHYDECTNPIVAVLINNLKK